MESSWSTHKDLDTKNQHGGMCLFSQYSKRIRSSKLCLAMRPAWAIWGPVSETKQNHPMVQTLLKRHLYQVCCSRYPCLVRFFAYVLLSHEMPAFSMARQCVLRVLCSSRSHYASSCYINNRKRINPQSVGNVKVPVPLLTYRTACSKVVWLD